MSKRDSMRTKAEEALYEVEHNMNTKEGVTRLISAAANALIHDVTGFNVSKANTLTYQSSVALRAIQERV